MKQPVKPCCLTCFQFEPEKPAMIGGSALCHLEPVTVAIANPKIHYCSHHQHWNDYIRLYQNYLSSQNMVKSEFGDILDVWGDYNCPCGQLGSGYHREGETSCYASKSGGTLVFRNDCPKCHGSGKIPDGPKRFY